MSERAIYFASVKESAIVFYALEFQEKTPLARFIEYPVVDQQVAESSCPIRVGIGFKAFAIDAIIDQCTVESTN